jgi:leucyl aminopeptidase
MVNVSTADWKKWNGKGQTLAVFAFKDDKAVRLLGLDKDAEAIAAQARSDGFKGNERETLVLRPANGTPAERLLLIGLGKEKDYDRDVLRRGASKVLRLGEKLETASVAVRMPRPGFEDLRALAEGLFLSAYRFDRHKKPAEDRKDVAEVTLYIDAVDKAAEAVTRAEVYSQATALARDLINEPPSRMNPERLAAEALKLNTSPITVKVIEGQELEELGMGGIIGVGAGGAVPPRLVELHYQPESKAKRVVALIGKGITFDSGGLSLKPAQSMETMKDDMSGAAAVLGVFSALSRLKPAVEVRGYLAIAENMPGGRAQKPGDVLKAFNGKTIEVLNTDAEGRLVLSDALSYAASKRPDVLIDIATLTGACVVALGHLVSAVMTNRPALAEAIVAAGEQTGEKFWQLPLVKEYKKDIKSKIADLKNIGSRRGEAGTIIGGLFLQEFVDDQPWVHLDIAGPSWTDSDQPYCPTGGTGHPVRTILHYLETL